MTVPPGVSANAVGSGDSVEVLDQVVRCHRRVVYRDGATSLEGERDVLVLAWCFARVGGGHPGVGGWLGPGIFDGPALVGDVPEIRVA